MSDIITKMDRGWDNPSSEEQMEAIIGAIRSYTDKTDDKVFFLLELREYLRDFISQKNTGGMCEHTGEPIEHCIHN